MRQEKISKTIKKCLVEKCNQEDIDFLKLKYGENHNSIYSIQRKITQIYNWFRIHICNKFEVPFMSVFLTQKCTLRCRNCSDLIPYYKRPENFNGRKILYCLKKYLSVVDCVHLLLLAGGEAFIYPELEQILKYCIHEKKIKRVAIVTNGTVIPDNDICRWLVNPKVRVRVSNYSCVEEKRKKVIQHLKAQGVFVEDLEDQKWFDVGGFEKRGRSEKQLKWIFSHCSMNKCFEINKNNVIYCARQRGAELELIPKNPKQDYVSLKRKDKSCLRSELLQMYDKDYLAACDYCDGITEKSIEIIPGEQ